MHGQALEKAYPYTACNALRPLAKGGGLVGWQLLGTNLTKQSKPAIEHRGGQARKPQMHRKWVAMVPSAGQHDRRPECLQTHQVRGPGLIALTERPRKHRADKLVLARAGIEAIHQSANLFVRGPLNATVVRNYSRHVASTPSELWIIVRSFQYGAP